MRRHVPLNTIKREECRLVGDTVTHTPTGKWFNSLLKNPEIGALAVFLPRVLGRSGCCEQTLTYAVSSLGMRIRL